MVFKQYRQMKDEEVLLFVQKKDQLAMDYLLEKYKYLVRQKARALYLIGGDKDDLIQEGMIGLYKAIRDYDLEQQVTFFTFADLCIARQMFNAIKASNRKKNIPLNTYVSFYSPIEGKNIDSEEKLSLVDVMFPNNEWNPEERIIDRENTKRLEEELNQQLSGLEKQVMWLYMKGLKYTEIASQLSKPTKSIDNALQRIRSKLTGILRKLEE